MIKQTKYRQDSHLSYDSRQNKEINPHMERSWQNQREEAGLKAQEITKLSGLLAGTSLLWANLFPTRKRKKNPQLIFVLLNFKQALRYCTCLKIVAWARGEERESKSQSQRRTRGRERKREGGKEEEEREREEEREGGEGKCLGLHLIAYQGC